MKKRSFKLVALRILKRFGLLCKPRVKDPYIRVQSVTKPDGTKTILSGKVHRDEIINEKDLESAIHVWTEIKKPTKTKKSTKKSK